MKPHRARWRDRLTDRPSAELDARVLLAVIGWPAELVGAARG